MKEANDVTVKGCGPFGPKQIAMILFTGLLMLLATCFAGGQNNTVFPVLAETRGWNLAAMNTLSGVAGLLDGIGILLFSGLSRKNTKVTAGVALILMAVCVFSYGRVENFGVFVVLMFLVGLSSGCFSSTCAMTLTANWWPTKKGVVLGFSTIGVVLMQIVYVPVMPVLFAKFGIANTQLALAIITFVVAIITFVFVKDTPEEAGTTPDGMSGVELEEAKKVVAELHAYKSPFTFKKMVKDPSNWLQSFALLLPFLVAMTFIASTIPTLLGYGYSMAFASTVFAVGGVFCIIGSVALGFIDQKFGTKKASIVYVLCMMVAIILAMFMQYSPICVWAAAMILMAANGSVRNLIPSFVATRYGRWDYTAAYAMIGTISMLGGSIGLMVMGLFSSPLKLYIFDFVLLVISLICVLFTKDTFIGKKD